jgi:hypothetical protein
MRFFAQERARLKIARIIFGKRSIPVSWGGAAAKSLRARTDAVRMSVIVVHHVVEEGMNHHTGKWAVVRVERRLASNGDVISSRRRLVGWQESQALADRECARLNGKRA